jgi:hypothetical protein
MPHMSVARSTPEITRATSAGSVRRGAKWRWVSRLKQAAYLGEAQSYERGGSAFCFPCVESAGSQNGQGGVGGHGEGDVAVPAGVAADREVGDLVGPADAAAGEDPVALGRGRTLGPMGKRGCHQNG